MTHHNDERAARDLYRDNWLLYFGFVLLGLAFVVAVILIFDFYFGGVEMRNSIKWGLVTFMGCITCAVLGHYWPAEFAAIFIALIAVVVSTFGGIAIAEEQREK